MEKYIKRIIGGYLILSLFASCSQSDENKGGDDGSYVHFTGQVNGHTRATDDGFEDEDTIGIFAFEEDKGFTSNSYATNVKYVYGDGRFNPEGEGISYPGTGGLAYWAIYPYCKQAAPEFVFHVNEDQRRVQNYTRSDLMTASIGKTTSLNPNLSFYHRLSCVVINLTFEDPEVEASQLEFRKVLKSAIVNMTTNTFVGTGMREAVIKATPDGGRRYKVILPPQTVERGTGFVVIAGNDGRNYTWVAPHDLVLESGSRHTYNLNVSLKGDITFTADIDPWGEPEDIEAIIPPAMLDSIEKYMPIYRGDTPPNVEGTYLVKPMTAVYCQDSVYEPGRVINTEIVRFANQNNKARTIEYSERNLYYTSSSENYTSYISGTGNNFTIYLETVGVSSGISTKTAGVYSGTISENGAIDFQYAFVMLDKGDDLYGELMDIGVFRVFRDGDQLSVRTTWDYTPADIGIDNIDITSNSILGSMEPVWQNISRIYTEYPKENYYWNGERLDSFLLQFKEDGTGSGFMLADPFTWTLSNDTLRILYSDNSYYKAAIDQLTTIGMTVKLAGTYNDENYGPCQYSNLITYRKVSNIPSVKSMNNNRHLSSKKTSIENLLKNGYPKDNGGVFDSKNTSRMISVRK